MGDEEYDSALRKLTTGTKLCTILRERPLVVLKQDTTVELALQVLLTSSSCIVVTATQHPRVSD